MSTATEETTTEENADAAALTEYQRRHYEEIKTLEDDAFAREGEYLDAKSEAKSAKELWERAVERLRSLIRSGPNPQQELPFIDEDWEATPVEDVLTELTDKQQETLTEAAIATVGQFEALRAGEGLTSLKGIGEVTADEWESQMLDWLAVNAREDEDEDDDSQDSGESES